MHCELLTANDSLCLGAVTSKLGSIARERALEQKQGQAGASGSKISDAELASLTRPKQSREVRARPEPGQMPACIQQLQHQSCFGYTLGLHINSKLNVLYFSVMVWL